MPDTPKSAVRKFLNDERGITDATLAAFGVVDDGDWIVYPTGKRRKHDLETGKRHFTAATGSTVGLFTGPNQGSTVAFLCEGESDAMRLWQELGTAPDVYGIPGVNTWKDEWASLFDQYEEVIVVLDNDEDYKVAAIVDKTWMSIRKALGRKAHRVVLPAGKNDICDFFATFDGDTFRMLVDQPLDTGWHFKALDLAKPLTKPDWLVEDLIAKGDLTMMIGEPGVGKSWISMALTVALVEGQATFLGHSMAAGSPRVLYVDEENPEVLVPYRLRKLGLTDKGIKNLRFLHQQGVRVDKHPEYLLEEALDFNPALIVLDSLTRIHTKDENNAGEISALFNDGIIPLARTTGATVLVLHHVNKTDSTSSFTRARGSSDLSGVIDCGLDVRGKDGVLKLIQYKSRWRESGHVINLKLTDVDENTIALTTHKDVARF